MEDVCSKEGTDEDTYDDWKTIVSETEHVVKKFGRHTVYVEVHCEAVMSRSVHPRMSVAVTRQLTA